MRKATVYSAGYIGVFITAQAGRNSQCEQKIVVLNLYVVCYRMQLQCQAFWTTLGGNYVGEGLVF